MTPPPSFFLLLFLSFPSFHLLLLPAYTPTNTQTHTTHLLLCAGTIYGEGFVRDLVNGAEATWLKPVTIEAGDLLVFEFN